MSIASFVRHLWLNPYRHFLLMRRSLKPRKNEYYLRLAQQIMNEFMPDKNGHVASVPYLLYEFSTVDKNFDAVRGLLILCDKHPDYPNVIPADIHLFGHIKDNISDNGIEKVWHCLLRADTLEMGSKALLLYFALMAKTVQNKDTVTGVLSYRLPVTRLGAILRSLDNDRMKKTTNFFLSLAKTDKIPKEYADLIRNVLDKPSHGG